MFWGQCNACEKRWPLGSPSECTCPQESNWQGLTDEDREDILRWIEWKEVGSQPVAPQKLIAYIERKLREKNHG